MAAIELVDAADAAHADGAAFVVGKLPQPVVESRRTQIEGAVQIFAIALQARVVAEVGGAVCDAAHQQFVIDHLAAHDAGFDESLEAFVDHLAAAVQADLEGAQSTALDDRGMPFQFGIQRRQHLAIGRVVGVAQDQRMAQCVGQRADADLQGAAVAHQRAGVEPDGVLRVGYRLSRQAEQHRVGAGRRHHRVEIVLLHRGGAAQPGQLRIHFRH